MIDSWLPSGFPSGSKGTEARRRMEDFDDLTTRWHEEGIVLYAVPLIIKEEYLPVTLREWMERWTGSSTIV